jgi:hypothetical protein
LDFSKVAELPAFLLKGTRGPNPQIGCRGSTARRSGGLENNEAYMAGNSTTALAASALTL